ncbi:MAG TPA: hypothetical protein VMT52_19175 [Planctomycetota bacterium]|nr:hypothetical protein [Planctomycetota bacterium]
MVLFGVIAGARAYPQEFAPEFTPLFNWDLVSLEQNNPRFNASVLSGFHSLRSPGVTPSRGWKTGLGLLYSREEQVATASNTELFRREQLLINPKINHGLLGFLEAGAGFEGSWARGRSLRPGPGDTVVTVPEEEIKASAVGCGLKWGFLRSGRLRCALAFDARIAVNRGAFGTLPASIYNIEVDAEYSLTNRFSVVTNLQFLTSDHFFDEDQVVFDTGAIYAFSDQFRGMLFGTFQDEERADNVLLFLGLAGQYVFEQHSFTLALDLQLNEARRDVRTQKQIDVELSYTFTF